MSDLELLFLVLAVIYGWECTCWLKHGGLGVRTWLGRYWRMVQPSNLLGNQRGGLIFAHPLPPLGTLLASSPLPVALGRDSAWLENPGARSPARRLFSYEELAGAKVAGKKVLLEGEVLARASSAVAALAIVKDLRWLSGLAPAQRPAAIEQLVQRSLDMKAAKRRWDQFQQRIGSLRLLTNGLFVFLFILAPVLIRAFGLRTCWPGLLAALLGFTVSTAILFGRAHRDLYPEAEDERFTHFLIILLSPATTIRAIDVLSRPLLEGFHPLTLAKLFGEEPQFVELARRTLREARHPAGADASNADLPAESTRRQWRAAVHNALESVLERNGLRPEDLAKAPTPTDETCLSYCPRCLAQFTSTQGRCADCGGVRLVSFASAAADAKSHR